MAKEKNEQPKKKLYSRLINKYRLVIMNVETFEEKASLTLTPMNVITVFGSVIIFLVTLTIYIIAFTPLREFIPGYPDGTTRKQYHLNVMKTDSLQKELNLKNIYIENLRQILLGQVPVDSIGMKPDTTLKKQELNMNISEEDSMLRAEVEQETRYNLSPSQRTGARQDEGMSSVFFFSPLKGMISEKYNPVQSHFGIDIVSPSNEPIKAALDGTILFSSWTSDTGYVIGIQHENNLVSMYKHNSALLKKTGAYVKAGEVIAIVGNTGEMTSGPHLHFELWHDGKPVNPQEYMVF
jgi:murein DD-endopeptidase MepM/ murein hydrolase activator NlpD